MKFWYFAALSLLFFCTVVWAAPTPKDCCLSWDGNETDWLGFYLYYALESEPTPRQYTDQRRVDIGLESPAYAVKTAIPNVKGSLCFRLTAYDDVGNESDFSNEACGWFGMGNPQNFEVHGEGQI